MPGKLQAYVRGVVHVDLGLCLAMYLQYDVVAIEKFTMRVPASQRRWHGPPVDLWFTKLPMAHLNMLLVDCGYSVVTGEEARRRAIPDSMVGVYFASKYTPEVPPQPASAKAPPRQAAEEVDWYARKEADGRDYAALYLVPGAPVEVVRAVWKVVARSHPDAGGDAERFKRANAAYQRILRALGSA